MREMKVRDARRIMESGGGVEVVTLSSGPLRVEVHGLSVLGVSSGLLDKPFDNQSPSAPSK